MEASDLDQVARSVCDARGYSFLGFVGAGAFKRTYHVKPSAGDSAALKIYQPGFSRERTAREIDAMQRCDHPGVCRLREIFLFDFSGLQFTVTTEEYLPDGTLANRGLLGPVEARALGGQLIDAVDHIASLDLVHRDIKPENIMFRGRTPVIVDFGLVRDLNASSLTQTWLASGPGTPFFASPEQLSNEKNLIDWRSDQFSLGVTLAICAFGNHPFAQNTVIVETVDRVIKRQGPSAQFIDNATKAGLPALVRMLAPWPVQRYRKPAELIAAWQAQA